MRKSLGMRLVLPGLLKINSFISTVKSSGLFLVNPHISDVKLRTSLVPRLHAPCLGMSYESCVYSMKNTFEWVASSIIHSL